MGSLGANGTGGLWGMGPFRDDFNNGRDKKRNRKPNSSGSGDAGGGASTAASYRFPLKQAATAAALALTGDTIAQLRQKWTRNKDSVSDSEVSQVILPWSVNQESSPGYIFEFKSHFWLSSKRLLQRTIRVKISAATSPNNVTYFHLFSFLEHIGIMGFPLNLNVQYLIYQESSRIALIN